MRELDIINNKSKIICLRIIVTYSAPIHLRRIVNLSKLQPRSVQLALTSLKKSKVLLSRKNKNRVEYFINKNFINLDLLLSIINNLAVFENRINNNLSSMFENSIKFIHETNSLVSKMKSKDVVR